MSRSDFVNILLSAREPLGEQTATGDVVARPKKGLVTQLSLTAGSDAATAVLRTGGASGDVVHTITAAAGATLPVEFPSGMYFSDGLHLTLSGTDAKLNGVGVSY